MALANSNVHLVCVVHLAYIIHLVATTATQTSNNNNIEPKTGEQVGEGDVSEVLRITRAQHEFGVLNLCLYPRAMRDEEVEAAHADVRSV